MQSPRRRDLNAFQRAPLFLDSFAAYRLKRIRADYCETLLVLPSGGRTIDCSATILFGESD